MDDEKIIALYFERSEKAIEKRKSHKALWITAGTLAACLMVVFMVPMMQSMFNSKSENLAEDNIGQSNEEIATASEDVWIYFVDRDEIHRKQEYLTLTSENIFSAWKIKNGIGDEVQLIKVEIDSNSTTSTSEYGDGGMVEHKIGDYFIYNITVSANIEAYYETIDSKLLLESLKQTMIGYSAIEYDEYHITFE